MLRRKTLLPLLGLLTLAAAAPACRKGSTPVIQFIADTDALVGQTLAIQVVAIDADGDELDFRFEAPMVPDVGTTTSMTRGPDGQGIFTFTPLASQIGSHFFDFYASDGKNEGRLTIEITVRGAVGSGSLPIFRKPLGSGTVLDLDQSDSISLDIAVEDPDSAEVTLSVTPPIIDNSNLSADSDGLSGSWNWTPTREQIEAADRYDLTLSADDGDNQPTLKDFIIVIRKRSGADCPGEAPRIEHTPEDFATVQDLHIQARVTDDMGVGSEPYLLWALEDPGDPVDFAKMALVEMRLDSGDMRDGMWSALVPNPVATQAEGTQATLYYLISAGDNDDADGDCDHLADAPNSGTFDVSVTNQPGEPGGRCDSCSFDVQCGGDDDLCVANAAGNFCGGYCEEDSDCSGTAICSPQPIDSVDGASARQCIPNSGTCEGGGGGTCDDDDSEPNNGFATAAGPLSPGEHGGLTLCPANEDWFEITVGQSAKITATLAGANPPDMDLALTTSNGVLIKSSVGLDSDEELTSPSCLDSGTYMLRVYTFNSTPGGDYTLGYSLNTSACGGGGTGVGDCCADNNSPGCEDPEIQTCVCGMDAFCCDTEWDDQCAAMAEDACGACGGTTGGTNEDCCTAQASPGCTDATIQACVCADDDFCCTDAWDNFCVGKVGSLLCAPSCSPNDDDGYCCDPDNGTPGCEINSIETCVCAADAFCCTDFWDINCVEAIAENNCGTATCP